MTDTPTAKKPRRRLLTVSNHLAAWAAIWFSIGFVVVIWMQTHHARALLYEAERRHNTHLTELVSAQLSEPLRDRRVPALRKAFNAMEADGHPGLVAAAALSSGGDILATYQKDVSNPFSFGTSLLGRDMEMQAGGVRTAARDGSLVVATPVRLGDDLEHAGTLVAAWSLAVVDRTAREMFVRTAALTLLLLLAFVTLSLVVVHRHFSDPLSRITEATTRIANGNKRFEIPCTERKDEVGDMARALVTFRQNVALIDRLTAEQQQQTQRLSNALEKERHFNALHREFVSMVSHEFRTPVAIIDGAAQRIERRIGKDTPDQLRERTGKIRSAVGRMIELIDSTLSVTRMEAGAIDLELGECDLSELLRDVCQRQRDLSQKHKISLIIADLPAHILVDAKRMDQVFTNLLSNAVKYAPDAPEIAVKAGTVGPNIVVSVRDHGLGIPEAEQPKLFEKFFRASTSTGIPGTGIGLHLVKHLIKLHDGNITVDSAEDRGTTFSVSFPIRQSAKVPAALEDSPGAPPPLPAIVRVGP